MRERVVTEQDVQAVLQAPASVVRDPNHRSYRLERTLPTGSLKVWVVEPWPPVGTIIVKSVAWRGR